MESFVKMNEIAVGESSVQLSTVVGSCIALCLWDRALRFGGMAHIMLPEHNGDLNAPPGKYADTAVRALVQKMIRNGCAPESLDATCAGGASLFNHVAHRTESIGQRNYRVVRGELDALRIPVVTEAVGGFAGRRIALDCRDGTVHISTLNRM